MKTVEATGRYKRTGSFKEKQQPTTTKREMRQKEADDAQTTNNSYDASMNGVSSILTSRHGTLTEHPHGVEGTYTALEVAL